MKTSRTLTAHYAAAVFLVLGTTQSQAMLEKLKFWKSEKIEMVEQKDAFFTEKENFQNILISGKN